MPSTYKVLVLIETTGTYGRSLVRGIVRYAKQHGPWIFFQESNPDELDIKSILKWNADGIIMRDREPFHELLSLKIPTIISSNYLQSHPTPVVTDDEKAISIMAAQHFLDRGFKHFAFCGQPYFWSDIRGQEFASYLAEQGYETHQFKKATNSNSNNQNNLKIHSENLAKWLVSLPKPLAVFVANDHLGRNIIDSLKEYKLKIPDDVAFLGVDDDHLACELCDPPLSSIKLNTETAGFEAAALLDRMMKGIGEKVQNIIIKPISVVTRQSSDIYVTADPEVNAALNYIRDNVRTPIQVCDVVKAAASSRRSLFYKFKKIRRRSILAEIKRARIEEIKRLLLETDMSISNISFAMGFSDASHISRYFRQAQKIDPYTYRMLHRK